MSNAEVPGTLGRAGGPPCVTLDERAVHEEAWLRVLGQSPIDTTLIWGELDSIAPPEEACTPRQVGRTASGHGMMRVGREP